MTNSHQKFDRKEESVFGRRIKNLRKMKGIKRESLAEELGISVNQIQKMETGYNRISASRLQKIAYFFGVSITCFYDLEVDIENPVLPLSKKDALILRNLEYITDPEIKQKLHEMIVEVAKQY